MGNIKESLKDHLDEYGFAHPTPGSVSQNASRFTAEYLLALKLHDELDVTTMYDYRHIYKILEKESGLLVRHPSNPNEQDSIDNYTGWLLASHLLHSPLMAQRVYIYGKKHFWFYKNSPGFYWFSKEHSQKYFGLNAFLGRFPALMVQMRISSGLPINWLQESIWCNIVGHSSNADRKDQDAWALAFALVKCSKGASKKIDNTRMKWIEAFKIKFPLGYGQLLKEYFADNNNKLASALEGEYGE